MAERVAGRTVEANGKEPLKAPFVYFGGKSRIAAEVWRRFGNVRSYVEPFCGSAAVLLGRPDKHEWWQQTETINDADGMIANVWRAIANDSEAVAHHADWPVNECVPAGTMIATLAGEVPVEDIVEGMVVLGFNGSQIVPTTVLATKQSISDSQLVRVGALSLTVNHPVWTVRGYMDAGNLTDGDIIGVLPCNWPVDDLDLCDKPKYPLQRPHTENSVAIYNFQTTTSNYFANRILVHNCDLHARHIWLVGQKESLQTRLEGDPEYYDAKIAGWWLWGSACWIGGGWCSGKGPWTSVDGQLVHLGGDGQGVKRQLVHLGGDGHGVNRQRVHLSDGGQGVNRRLVHLGDGGQGVNRRLVHLGGDGRGLCQQVQAGILAYMERLRDRLRRVRVCSGDWGRVVTPVAMMLDSRLVGVFLDPPYSLEAGRDMDIYAADCGEVAHEVRKWAFANGGDPRLRIAVCGYNAEMGDLPTGWTAYRWKSGGGYGSQGTGRGRFNANEEVVFFSPHCLKRNEVKQMEWEL